MLPLLLYILLRVLWPFPKYFQRTEQSNKRDYCKPTYWYFCVQIISDPFKKVIHLKNYILLIYLMMRARHI